MSLLTERDNFVGHFAANWSGTVPAYFPGEEFDEPTPTGNIASPASYQIVEVLYQSADRLTFGGVRIRRGSLVHNLWVERAGTDQPIQTAADAVVTLWRAAALSNTTIFPDEALLGDPVSDGPWEGRALSIPFWVIEEETATVASQATASKTVSQASHGFSSLDAIYKSGATWVKAQADASATLARGIVTRAWNTNEFDVTFYGAITVTGHGVGAAGTDFYLSQSVAGAITTTQPPTGWSQHLGFVDDANNLVISIGAGVWQ